MLNPALCLPQFSSSAADFRNSCFLQEPGSLYDPDFQPLHEVVFSRLRASYRATLRWQRYVSAISVLASNGRVLLFVLFVNKLKFELKTTNLGQIWVSFCAIFCQRTSISTCLKSVLTIRGKKPFKSCFHYFAYSAKCHTEKVSLEEIKKLFCLLKLIQYYANISQQIVYFP